MNNFKLAEIIAPNFEEYTSIELAVLLRSLILEVERRQKASPKVIDHLNQKTFDYTHQIELNEGLSRVEKADFYEEMEKHFKDRRMAKKEHIITDEIFDELSWNTTQLMQLLTPELKKKISYFQLESGKRAIKKAEWKEYYDNVYKPYL